MFDQVKLQPFCWEAHNIVRKVYVVDLRWRISKCFRVLCAPESMRPAVRLSPQSTDTNNRRTLVRDPQVLEIKGTCECYPDESASKKVVETPQSGKIP